MGKIARTAVSLFLVIAMLFGVTACKRTALENTAQTDTVNAERTTATTTAPVAKKPTENTDKAMLKIIQQHLPKDSGKWAVYYKNLKDNRTVSIQNKKMVSASLIKLFIMATVYEEIEQGNLKDTENIEQLMEKMITVSHNDSSNELVRIAGGGDFQKGMKTVNDYARKIGCPDTEQQRNMLDDRPVPIPEQNYTSVKDCGTLLEKIYCKQCVSAAADKKMLDYLCRQERTWKIPAGLPEGVKSANKTGEMSTTENDVAIVFTPQADYILCVISNDVKDTQSARESIRDISAAVYARVTEKTDK